MSDRIPAYGAYVRVFWFLRFVFRSIGEEHHAAEFGLSSDGHLVTSTTEKEWALIAAQLSEQPGEDELYSAALTWLRMFNQGALKEVEEAIRLIEDNTPSSHPLWAQARAAAGGDPTVLFGPVE